MQNTKLQEPKVGTAAELKQRKAASAPTCHYLDVVDTMIVKKYRKTCKADMNEPNILLLAVLFLFQFRYGQQMCANANNCAQMPSNVRKCKQM